MLCQSKINNLKKNKNTKIDEVSLELFLSSTKRE